MSENSTVRVIVLVGVMAIPFKALAMGDDAGIIRTVAVAHDAITCIARTIRPATSGIGWGSKGAIKLGKPGASIDEIDPHATR
jgi:hypothetical protein